MKEQWVVQTQTVMYGPFKTAQAAANWARKQLMDGVWKLAQLVLP